MIMPVLKFDSHYWKSRLIKKDWYLHLRNELERIIFNGTSITEKGYKSKLYLLVSEMLDKNEIPLAQNGPNFDINRKPIDTIVIHHTGESSANPKLLSASGLMNQYAREYMGGKILGHNLSGRAIWSNHFKNGKQVFFVYHWIILESGRVEKLLRNSYIAWHSGNWDVNTRSIAIAFSGNYNTRHPSKAQILAVKEILKKYYPQITKESILGHSEINPKTDCPGKIFDTNWKGLLP
jgi:hypothetical protein